MDVTSIFQVDIQTFLIFVVTLLLGYYFLHDRRKYPPTPASFPIIGAALWFRRLRKEKKRIGPALMEDAKRLGSNVLLIKAGPRNMVFIHSFDLIHELFVKQSAMYSNRPPYLPNQKNIQEGRGVIWQSGHAWKILRKFALQSLRDFGLGKTSLEEKVFEEVEAATEYFKGKSGNPTDVRELSGMMIANVIYRIVFGKRFDYKDGEFHEIIEHLDGLFKFSLLARADMTPRFIKRFIDPQFFRDVEERNKIFEWVRKHVYSQIEHHEATYETGTIRDFVDLYIEAKQGGEDKEIYTVGNIFRLIMDLFIAGSETTSNTVNWSILYMIEYSDIQKRCQEEISQQIGDKSISWSDRSKLPFVEATLLEIQRVANIANFALPHTNEEDTYIEGYFIPKHSMIQANLLSANMDPKHWEEPDKFNPVRFLENGHVKKNPAFIPFSTGPRVCLGESLARLEMFLIFSNLLQRFNFTREHQDVPNKLVPRLGQVTSAPLDYKVRAIIRG